MSIKRKFMFITAGTILSYLLSIGIYYLIYSPVIRIQDEEEYLVSLSYAFRDMRTEMARIDNAPLKTQVDRIQAVEEEMEAVFENVENMKYLPAASQDIEEAIGIILNLKELFQKNLQDLSDVFPEMLDYSEKLLLSNTATVNLSKLENTVMKKYLEDGTLARGKITWQKMITAIGMIDTSLVSSIHVLDEQFVNIEKKINEIGRRALYISIGVVAVIIFLVFLILTLFTNRMAVNIKRLEEGIQDLFSGNLLTEVRMKSNDELGTLSGNLNSFIKQLNSGIKDIKESAGHNQDVKTTLTGEVGETITRINHINIRTGNITRIMESLNSSIDSSTRGVKVLGDNVEKMTHEISNQLAMVEESSSAVTEMITSISNVADITEKKEKATQNLVYTARNGGEQLENTRRIIREIHDSIDEISGTASVIQGVASQTNLLAMNAAIEAAHAGESGRGFAVVADEIRKLAETSSVNSKRISGVIKEVISNIEKAVSSGMETQKAFTDIDSEVQGVSDSLNEITASMSELNTGGEQILKAMDELQSVSVAVTNSGREMADVSSNFDSSIKDIETISKEVSDGTTEIEAAIREISGSMDKVSGLAVNLDKISGRLSDEVNRYITSEDDADSASRNLDDENVQGYDGEELLFEEYKGD